jgi:hypothetical protein
MIDPLTALAGIQSAISMVKKASAVANDLGSLAPMIGKLFDAKSTATKALIEAKKGKGSNMGTALQIEMALEQARVFEDELKLLFMTTGKVDVWNKIKARQHEMDLADAKELSALKAEEKKRKEKEKEQLEIVFALSAAAFILFIFGIGMIELLDYCSVHGCGR